MSFWLLKTEPETFSMDDLLSKEAEPWDGVRNYQARNFIAQMQPGDLCLIYHSGKEKAVVGIGKVVSYPFQDPGTSDERWLSVDIAPVRKVEPFSLEQIKGHPELNELMLLKQSRLSVMPLDENVFRIIIGEIL
jgi:predicted RNA-binding protein with PUA-like domain